MMDVIINALVGAGILAAILLFALIIRALIANQQGGPGDEVLASSDVSAQTPPEPGEEDKVPSTPSKPESETQRLARQEKELAQRESKVKADKIKELQERENIIKRRGADLTSASAQTDTPRDDIAKERDRIMELIKKAEESYASGALEEKNFKRIVSDYQQQIIDINIKLKKRGGL